MVLGAGIIELLIPDSRSLKDKRGILKRILKRTQNEFNISIAEVGLNDHLKRAVIGFCTVGNDKRYINAKIDHIYNFINELKLSEIVGKKYELIDFDDSLSTVYYEEDKYL